MAHKALGRGLEALLKPVTGNLSPAAEGTIAKIPVDKIRANRYQPRVRFTPESLQELADSIQIHGLAQPLLVAPSAVPGEFELVAGERRLRASRMAGLVDVPCVVRVVTDRERHELSLVENLQREDLNAIEEAESIKKLDGRSRADPRRSRPNAWEKPVGGRQQNPVVGTAPNASERLD
jgi:ParB family chromosome partitioning protein